MKNAVIFNIVFHIVILQAPGLANSPGASLLELIISGFELIAKIAQKLAEFVLVFELTPIPFVPHSQHAFIVFCHMTGLAVRESMVIARLRANTTRQQPLVSCLAWPCSAHNARLSPDPGQVFFITDRLCFLNHLLSFIS
ncbi:MAG: hypothetical protein WCR34_02930 [Bacilli bacterium]